MNKSPHRVLVTGGAGFIGSHTVDALLGQEKEVVVLDNLFSGKLENLDLRHPNLEFVEGDVLDFFLLEELLNNCDTVLHLAAISSVLLSIENPIYAFQVNTQGFLHVLQAIYRTGRPIRLVYASSAAVYGDVSDLPCREEQASFSKPLSPYALQKRYCEEYADLYARLHSVSSLALRYFNVYGHRQDPTSPYSGVISKFIEAYKNDQELLIFGDGKQSRDYIHVSDIATANLLALASDYQGVVNIGTGQANTLLKLIDDIVTAGQKPAKKNFAPARPGDIKVSYAATELAKKHLEFQYSVQLQTGIQSLLSAN